MTASVFPSVPTKVHNCKRFYANYILYIHLSNVHFLPESSAGPNHTLLLLHFSSLLFWQPSLSSSACGSHEFSICVFVSVLLFPQILNSPANSQMLNQFFNVYTFDTEGHLTLLTLQTTSDLELNAPSQSIFCPKYKQKCFNLLFL